MEAFSLIFALPVTLVTSTVFCLLAFWAFRRFPGWQIPVAIPASLIVFSVGIELVMSFLVGPLELHRRFDGIHHAVHTVNFFLAPPAIACVILVALRRAFRPLPLCFFAIGVCWFTCMASLFGNIVVDEAIYGVDGSGVSPTQNP